MTLQSLNGKRQFTIYEQNFNFLMGLLAHDISKDNTISLTDTNRFINKYDSIKIVENIKHIIEGNNKIYECWDGIKVEPLINPTFKKLKKLKGVIIQDITDKRKSFLNKLILFLESNEDLELIWD